MRRELIIVLYHHIAEDGDPLTKQLGLATRPDAFEKHVRYFAQNFDFVSGSDLICGVLPPRPLLITFDDAYRSVLDVGAAILKNASAPSVFFINPATLTGATLPIDNVLSLAIEECGRKGVSAILNITDGGISSAVRRLRTSFRD
ncbi:MAG: hypothetical protein E6G85_05770 [Alphaproteobacteria bacterium]|nr:MAG: hypothetical protein E6G85_05770 [Alphaproteobacteria bacterium]